MSKENENIEKELRQVKSCLGEKDKRIGVLETSLEYLGERREDLIRWFNFLSIVGFAVAMAVLVGVCYYFYPDWFVAVAGYVAIIGTVGIVGNLLICVSGFIFDSNGEDIALRFFVFNVIVVPSILGLCGYFGIVYAFF